MSDGSRNSAYIDDGTSKTRAGPLAARRFGVPAGVPGAVLQRVAHLRRARLPPRGLELMWLYVSPGLTAGGFHVPFSATGFGQ